MYRNTLRGAFAATTAALLLTGGLTACNGSVKVSNSDLSSLETTARAAACRGWDLAAATHGASRHIDAIRDAITQSKDKQINPDGNYWTDQFAGDFEKTTADLKAAAAAARTAAQQPHLSDDDYATYRDLAATLADAQAALDGDTSIDDNTLLDQTIPTYQKAAATAAKHC